MSRYVFLIKATLLCCSLQVLSPRTISSDLDSAFDEQLQRDAHAPPLPPRVGPTYQLATSAQAMVESEKSLSVGVPNKPPRKRQARSATTLEVGCVFLALYQRSLLLLVVPERTSCAVPPA